MEYNPQKMHFALMKKKPKKNAKEYKLETIDDIYKCVNSKNIDKFFKEFKTAIKLNVIMRELVEIEMKRDGKVMDADEMKMTDFVWIDD